MKLVVLVGLPASGKSTYLERMGANAVSSDAVRALIADDAEIQTINRRVFSVVRFLIRQRLELGRPVTYVDSTSLTPKERKPYLALGELYGCDVEAVYFDVPIEVSIERNEKRTRRVPRHIIREMARKLVVPTLAEGFSRIEVVGHRQQ